FAASCRSMSVAYGLTCCSIKRIVSSETLSLDFFSWLMASDRTLLRDSLALWLNSLASLARFSLCSRVTLWAGTHAGMGTLTMEPSTSGLSLMLLSLRARTAAAVTCGPIKVMLITMRCGDFMEIWPSCLRGTLPFLVLTMMWSRAPGEGYIILLLLLVLSSLRLESTASMSSFTSCRLMMSSTSSALIFSLACGPFPLAGEGGGEVGKKEYITTTALKNCYLKGRTK
uniref:Uncharacterized protein n=1 Tax=Scleropages formosus TaxID=113540 RepID=A0A8C9R070_SCLFO